jgi:5-methylthioadenosine/S-adenosylhomocysteine deaminase
VWATDEDIALAADHGVNVASNAGSNLRLSSGIARVRDLLAGGARVCFGTDGISFSDREDFFAELRLAAYLQRQPDVFMEHRLDSAVLLAAVGDNGARALRAEGRVGRIEPGADADLLVVRTDRVMFPPGRYDAVPVLDVLLDRADASDIDVVMVRGRVLLEGGEVRSVDEHRVMDRLRELADRPGGLHRRDEVSARRLDLANQLVPHAVEIYDRWYEVPVPRPAAVYNTRDPLVP